MSAIVATIKSSALKKGIESAIDKVIAGATASIGQKLKNWQASKAIASAASKLDLVRNVKTIWKIDKPVDLFNFYYPSRLQFDDRRVPIARLSDIPHDGNIVIQGTVGQGKSIFLRYLTCVEAVDGQRIPLFIELRRLKPKEKLQSHLIEELCALGLQADNEVFDYLASHGHLTLLLDGFDEVRERSRGALIAQLERLVRRHPELPILVTSRPGSGIERSSLFDVCALSPLLDGEYEEVIRKICFDRVVAESIIKGVRDSGRNITSLLTTPLMVSLLVLRYAADQSIPDNYNAFFRDLFMLLLQRHDKSKAGYVRPRRSKLGDRSLEDVFVTICFLTRKRGESAFHGTTMHSIVKEALTICRLEARPDDVINDLSNITCLLLEEGGEYRFIHKSVQEYHAAQYLAQECDEYAYKFYQAMKRHWLQWQEELRFLEILDAYKYFKAFAVPMMQDFFGEDGEDVLARRTVSWFEFRVMAWGETIITLPAKVMDNSWCLNWLTLGRLPMREYRVVDTGLRRLSKDVKVRGKLPSTGNLTMLADAGILAEEITRLGQAMVAELQRGLADAYEEIERVEQRGLLMDF